MKKYLVKLGVMKDHHLRKMDFDQSSQFENNRFFEKFFTITFFPRDLVSVKKYLVRTYLVSLGIQGIGCFIEYPYPEYLFLNTQLIAPLMVLFCNCPLFCNCLLAVKIY